MQTRLVDLYQSYLSGIEHSLFQDQRHLCYAQRVLTNLGAEEGFQVTEDSFPLQGAD